MKLDLYRLSRAGEVLERSPGAKRVAIRPRPDGPASSEPVAAHFTAPVMALRWRRCGPASLGELAELIEVGGSAGVELAVDISRLKSPTPNGPSGNRRVA